MISSASPISQLARANPLGNAATGMDAPAQGDTGFSALFAGLMPADEQAIAGAELQPATLPLALAKAAMTGKFGATAAANGKNLPASLLEAIAADDEAISDGPASGLNQAESPVADAALNIAILSLPIAMPQVMTVQQLVASQAARRAPALPDTASPAAHLATSLDHAGPKAKGDEKQVPGSIMARNGGQSAPVAAGNGTTAPAPFNPAQPAVQLSVAATPAVPLTGTAALPTVAQLRPRADAKANAKAGPVGAIASAAEAAAFAPPAAKAAKAATPLSDRSSPALPEIAAAPAFSAVASAQSVAAAPLPATTANAPTPSEDVARIIDQLAAAREALAPATAALNIEHAEFGELSLRIDQRADGGLAVQVAASNLEAHRAVSAAMGAQSGGNDGGQATQSDGQAGGTSAQGNSPSANGNSADRDAPGNSAHNRQDQSHPRGPSASSNTRNDSETQSGTFA